MEDVRTNDVDGEFDSGPRVCGITMIVTRDGRMAGTSTIRPRNFVRYRQLENFGLETRRLHIRKTNFTGPHRGHLGIVGRTSFDQML